LSDSEPLLPFLIDDVTVLRLKYFFSIKREATMDNLKKKPFEVPTLTQYGTLSEITQNSLKINHGHAWAWGHYKFDDVDELGKLSVES
jgi:hypothetical protein